MRWLAAAILLMVPVFAQTRLTLDQLRSFLKSSVDLHQSDKQVADYLKKSKLTHRLVASIISPNAIISTRMRADCSMTLSVASAKGII